MSDLVERNSNMNVVNQLLQNTGKFNCTPNIPLWIKLVKANGFLAPLGNSLGGFITFLFRPGYSHVTAANE